MSSARWYYQAVTRPVGAPDIIRPESGARTAHPRAACCVRGGAVPVGRPVGALAGSPSRFVRRLPLSVCAPAALVSVSQVMPDFGAPHGELPVGSDSFPWSVSSPGRHRRTSRSSGARTTSRGLVRRAEPPWPRLPWETGTPHGNFTMGSASSSASPGKLHAARRTPHAARRTPHAARRTPRRTPHAAHAPPHARPRPRQTSA